jgi:hypothetical protein
VVSFTVANLKPELKYVPIISPGTSTYVSLRYRTENLLISAMTPGPTEPTAEQLQHQLKLIVDDLLLLYDYGILVKTPLFPNGTSLLLLGSKSQLM